MWDRALIGDDKHSRKPSDVKKEVVEPDLRHLTVSDDSFRKTESNSAFLATSKKAYHRRSNSSGLKSDVRDSSINDTTVQHVEIVKPIAQTVKDIWTFEPNGFRNINEIGTTVGNMKLNTIVALTRIVMSKSDHIYRFVHESDLRDLIAIDRKLSVKCARRTNAKSFISMKNMHYLRANHYAKRLPMSFVWIRRTLLNRKSDNFLLRHCRFHSSAGSVRTSCDQRDNSCVVRQLPPWRILFFGTDGIALHTLKDLYANMYVLVYINLF